MIFIPVNPFNFKIQVQDKDQIVDAGYQLLSHERSPQVHESEPGNEEIQAEDIKVKQGKARKLQHVKMEYRQDEGEYNGNDIGHIEKNKHAC